MKFAVVVHFVSEINRLKKEADKASRKWLFISSARIRKTAVQSVERRRGPSPPGTPVHTHRGVFFRRAIRFRVDTMRLTSVIGPRHSIVGDVGHVHEFGGQRHGRSYPPRPVMGPALEARRAQLGSTFEGLIGG